MRSNLLLALSALFFVSAVVWRVVRPEQTVVQTRLPGEVLAVGETVPDFWRDLGMRDVPQGPVLVTFLTTECPWCRITVPHWNEIDAAVRNVPGSATVAISLSHPDSTRTYPLETGLRLPLRVSTDKSMKRRWKVAAVPYTLLMEPSGRVIGVWRGALTHADAIEAVGRIRSWHGIGLEKQVGEP